ncbi:Restriction endonuclease [Pseudomonas sp. 58 R 12]|nr:Restriction endonuclease [Pseudomonas sp. 58 R 12]
MVEDAEKNGRGVDPWAFVRRCHKKLGALGLEMAIEQVMVFHQALRMSLFSHPQINVWDDTLTLSQLFNGLQHTPQEGAFIDQRFSDYLSVNSGRLPEMHWRRFEELTAEFFNRESFHDELGPGFNDDGVDVMGCKPDASPMANLLGLIQYKRVQAKVEKLVIKGLASDVQFEKAGYGVIVTTSTLSPGAKTTIESRGYPIRAVERDAVAKWLVQLLTPGTGLIRI